MIKLDIKDLILLNFRNTQNYTFFQIHQSASCCAVPHQSLLGWIPCCQNFSKASFPSLPQKIKDHNQSSGNRIMYYLWYYHWHITNEVKHTHTHSHETQHKTTSLCPKTRQTRHERHEAGSRRIPEKATICLLAKICSGESSGCEVESMANKQKKVIFN